MVKDIRKSLRYNLLDQKARGILQSGLSKIDKLKAICSLLKNIFSHYDWVGFYAVEKLEPKELVLVTFEGESTEHERIPFGKGICGQAALIKKTIIVQNVSKEPNYLSCSPKVKSEIVIPIFRNNDVVGELDIDSHTASAFTLDDQVFLEDVAKMLSGLF